MGVVTEKSLGDGRYTIVVSYPDKVWSYNGTGAAPPYTRDASGNLYSHGDRQAIRFDSCGYELARVTMPKTRIKKKSYDKKSEPQITVLEEYGAPQVSSNGDLYAWKRTPTTYSILKWTWVDDSAKQDKACSDAEQRKQK